MEFSNVEVPFLSKGEIRKEAKKFRKKFWDRKLPMDIERIIERKLGINIIPDPGLKKHFGINAFISSDWKSLYVDKNSYEENNNRLRFSFAHEIGHFHLHKNIYQTFNINTSSDYRRLVNTLPRKQYSYFEIQANKFAGFLLIPQEILKNEKEKIIKSKADLPKGNKKLLNSYLAIPLSGVFGVSEEAVEIALNDLDDLT